MKKKFEIKIALDSDKIRKATDMGGKEELNKCVAKECNTQDNQMIKDGYLEYMDPDLESLW